MTKKLHVLFLSEGWCDGNPEHGPTTQGENLFGALEASGLATQDRFYLDQYWAGTGTEPGPAIIAKCEATKPDLVVLSPPYIPQYRYIHRIKDSLKIPMISCCGDSAHPIVRGWAEDILPFLEFDIVTDTYNTFSRTSDHPEKFIPLWSPRDKGIYNDPGLTRDIDVGFAGNMGAFPDRVKGIAALKEMGVNVYQSGGYREHKLPVEEYASIYKRSKIAVNFCYNILGIAQCKGRVYESTMCGTMLLEAANPETAVRFEPMVDYIPFRNVEELVEKARYYLEHDSERLEIASNGHKRATENYNGDLFWRIVLEKLFGKERADNGLCDS